MAGSLPDLEPSDPDAQATINDFSDYTEFLPSDLLRSLTLIGSLDQSYHNDAQTIHNLTKTYGSLRTLPPESRPEPQALRKDISATLQHAMRSREATLAEATRVHDTIVRMHDRLAIIKSKLVAMPKPPSRESSPVQSRSPVFKRGAGWNLTELLDVSTPQPGPKPRTRPRKLVNQVIYPGQVLPPLDQFSPDASESSDYDSSDSDTVAVASKKNPLKSLKIDKIKLPKIPAIRMSGVLGTNAHSSVAGISTSNAIALLERPPENAAPGSRHRPWLKLTEYEMAMLRKKMKKNAVWHPSSTMVRRELSVRGRGMENYKNAKRRAEETGEPLLDEDPLTIGSTALAPGELTLAAADLPLVNRGMKLNAAKKSKRDSLMREQAARDAAEIEQVSRRIANASLIMQGLFNNYTNGDLHDTIKVHQLPKAASAPPRKRTHDALATRGPPPPQTPQPAPKKLKLILPSAPTIKSSAPSTSAASSTSAARTVPRNTRAAPATAPSAPLTLKLTTPVTTAPPPTARHALRPRSTSHSS